MEKEIAEKLILNLLWELLKKKPILIRGHCLCLVIIPLENEMVLHSLLECFSLLRITNHLYVSIELCKHPKEFGKFVPIV